MHKADAVRERHLHVVDPLANVDEPRTPGRFLEDAHAVRDDVLAQAADDDGAPRMCVQSYCAQTVSSEGLCAEVLFAQLSDGDWPSRKPVCGCIAISELHLRNVLVLQDAGYISVQRRPCAQLL